MSIKDVTENKQVDISIHVLSTKPKKIVSVQKFLQGISNIQWIDGDLIRSAIEIMAPELDFDTTMSTLLAMEKVSGILMTIQGEMVELYAVDPSMKQALDDFLKNPSSKEKKQAFLHAFLGV